MLTPNEQLHYNYLVSELAQMGLAPQDIPAELVKLQQRLHTMKTKSGETAG